MLKKILSPETCAKCRICCGFVDEDKWEIPLIFPENKDRIKEKFGFNLVPRGNEYVFDMEFDGDRLVYCPAESEHGCVLGGLKPFDCSIWPFRVNELCGKRVITVSPVCPGVSSLPLDRLCSFVREDGFAEMLFRTADEHPDMVKPYIDGYPILLVEEKSDLS